MTIAVGFEPGHLHAVRLVVLRVALGLAPGSVGASGCSAASAGRCSCARRALRDEPGGRRSSPSTRLPPAIDALESAVLLGRTAQGDPGRSARAGGGGQHPDHRRRAELLRRRPAARPQLVDPTRADGDGLMLLDGLFPGLAPGEEYEFGQTDRRLSSAAQKILKAADERARAARAASEGAAAGARASIVVATAIAAALVFVFGLAALDASVDPRGCRSWSSSARSSPNCSPSRLVSHKPLTALGAETRDHLDGLKQFIEWAEADRIRMLQSTAGRRARADRHRPTAGRC